MIPTFCISWGNAMRHEGMMQSQSRMLCRATEKWLRTKMQSIGLMPERGWRHSFFVNRADSTRKKPER